MNDELTQLRDELASMRAALDASTHRIEELERAASAAVTPSPPPDGIEEPRTDPGANTATRRTAFRMAAGAAVGAAGALVASTPAAGDDPFDVTLGASKVHAGGVTRAAAAAEIDDMAFLFEAGSVFTGFASQRPAALGGWTTQSSRPNGVFGYTNQQGSGVVGICQTNGTSWFPKTGVGVSGFTDRPGFSGVIGTATGGGAGVVGEGDVGVRARANSNGTGLDAEATGPRGLGARLVGARAGVALTGPGSTDVSTPPYGPNGTTDSHSPGELLYTRNDSSNDPRDDGLWACVEFGTPGSWRCLAHPLSAGTLFPITPVRIYDSRLEMAPDPDGPVSEGQVRTFSAANARDVTTGAVTTTDVIPAEARAVAFNLTISETVAGGFVFLAPGGTTTVTASTVNWGPANTGAIANAGIVQLDAQRRLSVLCGGPGAATQIIVDITGFYL